MTGLLQSPGPPPPTQEELEVKELEKRVAEACMEGVSEEDCREIISQVLRWLETKPLDFVSRFPHPSSLLTEPFEVRGT